MPTNIYTVSATLLFVTLLTRLSPLLIGKYLQSQAWVEKMSKQLPCMILVLLLIFEIEAKATMPGESGISVLVGITLTLLAHFFFRQVILSLAIGVISYAAVQHLM